MGSCQSKSVAVEENWQSYVHPKATALSTDFAATTNPGECQTMCFCDELVRKSLKYPGKGGVIMDADERPMGLAMKGYVERLRFAFNDEPFPRMNLFSTESGKPIAFFVVPSPLKYKICSTKPFHKNQSQMKQKEGSALYEWATIYPQPPIGWGPRGKMMLADNETRFEMHDPPKGKSTLALTRNGKSCGTLNATAESCSGIEGGRWRLTVGPGIDPCLMVLFVAIVDEAIQRGFEVLEAMDMQNPIARARYCKSAARYGIMDGGKNGVRSERVSDGMVKAASVGTCAAELFLG